MTKTGTAGEPPPTFRVGFPHVEVFLFYVPEPKVSEKKKLMEKIKEKENRLKKKQEEVKKSLEDEVCGAINALFQLRAAFASLVFLQEEELSPEEQLAEKLRVKKLQEESDLELTKDAFGEDRQVEKRLKRVGRQRVIGVWAFSGVGGTSNSVTGIDAMCPSSKEEFNEFERLLKEKFCQFEKSVHYSSFLESLFRELCISCKRRVFSGSIAVEFASAHLCFSPLTVEVDDLKKVSNSLSVLLSEKQKQEKVSVPSTHCQFRRPPTGGAGVRLD